MPWASATYHASETQTIEVEVGCEADPHPDLMDMLTARCASLLAEVMNAVGAED